MPNKHSPTWTHTHTHTHTLDIYPGSQPNVQTYNDSNIVATTTVAELVSFTWLIFRNQGAVINTSWLFIIDNAHHYLCVTQKNVHGTVQIQILVPSQRYPNPYECCIVINVIVYNVISDQTGSDPWVVLERITTVTLVHHKWKITKALFVRKKKHPLMTFDCGRIWILMKTFEWEYVYLFV